MYRSFHFQIYVGNQIELQEKSCQKPRNGGGWEVLVEREGYVGGTRIIPSSSYRGGACVQWLVPLDTLRCEHVSKIEHVSVS